MKKHKRDLALALPSQAEACDACIEQLLQALAGRRGIESAHVDRTDVETPKLCLHYDPTACCASTSSRGSAWPS